MRFDDLVLEQLTIQANYPDSYLMWDRAGELATELSRVWPKCSLENAEPGEVVLVASRYKVLFGIRMSYVHLQKPKSFSEFQNDIAATFKLWADVLRITDFTRIGCRAIYSHDFEDGDKARSKLKELGLARWPKRKVFNIDHDSPLSAPGLAYRFEDEQVGTVVKVSAQSLKLELSGTDLVEQQITKEHNKILIDVDRFTKKPLPSSSFNPVEWMAGYHHLIRRDLPEVVGIT